MAEPKPAPSEDQPKLSKLAAVPEQSAPQKAPETPAAQSAPKGQAPAADAEKPDRSGSRWGLWLLVALVAGAVFFAWVQTQRLDRAEGRVVSLSEQIVALQAQLAAANLQIDTYEMQQAQVREAVSDLSQRILMLNELVGGPTQAPPVDEAAPEASEALGSPATEASDALGSPAP